jgi:glycosyltransferase involved in cell wall biosynthesis
MRTQIFWCHPRLRDYRQNLFQLMCQAYTVRFLFQMPSDADQDFEHTYTKRRKIISTMRPIPLADVRTLYQGIKGADVYISSLIWCSYTIIGLVIAKLLGKKVIVCEEINIVCSDLKSKLKYTLARLLFRYIDALFVTGEIHKTILIQLGAVPEKIFAANEYPGQIYHTISPQAVNLPFNKGTPIVLFLGRLIEIKGVEHLIRAFGLLEQVRSDVALLIVGDGPLRQELETLTTTLGARNVHFAGEITDIHQKAYLFQRSRLVVVPSITTKYQREGGPMVVLEALSAGKPVIGTTALGSNRAFIEDGVNGYIVPEKDANALFDKMEMVFESQNISEKRVLDTFDRIRGHEYQAERLQAAICYALMHGSH